MIKNLCFQMLVAASLLAALLIAPTLAKAEDQSTPDTKSTKSGLFIRPAYGLDIKPDGGEKKNASIFSSRRLPLSDTIDISTVFEKQKKDIIDKKSAANQRALLDITFRF